MRQLLNRLDRFGRAIEDVALTLLLGSMMLLAVGQIVLREVFETGFVWADELIKLLVLWLAMVGSIAASRDDRHIRIDVLSHVLPDRLVGYTRLIVDLFAAFVAGFIAWHAFRWTRLEKEFGDTVLIDIPAWLAHIIMPAAFALICLRFLVLTARHAHAISSGEDIETQS